MIKGRLCSSKKVTATPPGADETRLRQASSANSIASVNMNSVVHESSGLDIVSAQTVRRVSETARFFLKSCLFSQYRINGELTPVLEDE